MAVLTKNPGRAGDMADHGVARIKARLAAGRALGAALGAVGTVAALTLHAAPLKELPAGPNRDLVARECQACHDLDNVLEGAGASRESWDGAIEQMVGYGLSVTPDERAKILDYLATYLGPDPPS
jgi:hypothetical protein